MTTVSRDSILVLFYQQKCPHIWHSLSFAVVKMWSMVLFVPNNPLKCLEETIKGPICSVLARWFSLLWLHFAIRQVCVDVNIMPSVT